MSELQLILLLFCILFGLVSTTDQNPVKVDTATTVVVSQHAPNPDSKKLLPSSSFIPEGNNLHNEVYPNSTGLLDDRTSDLMLDAKNSLKVFFKSLHANRSLEESFAIAVTTFANSRSARLISTQKFMLSRDMSELCLSFSLPLILSHHLCLSSNVIITRSLGSGRIGCSTPTNLPEILQKYG